MALCVRVQRFMKLKEHYREVIFDNWWYSLLYNWWCLVRFAYKQTLITYYKLLSKTLSDIVDQWLRPGPIQLYLKACFSLYHTENTGKLNMKIFSIFLRTGLSANIFISLITETNDHVRMWRNWEPRAWADTRFIIDRGWL